MDHPQVPTGAEGAKRGLFHATVYPGLGPRLWKAPVVARLHPRPSNLPLRLHGIPVICLLFMALVSKIVIRFHTVHPRRQSVQEQKEEKNKYYSVGGPEHTSTRNEKKGHHVKQDVPGGRQVAWAARLAGRQRAPGRVTHASAGPSCSHGRRPRSTHTWGPHTAAAPAASLAVGQDVARRTASYLSYLHH